MNEFEIFNYQGVKYQVLNKNEVGLLSCKEKSPTFTIPSKVLHKKLWFNVTQILDNSFLYSDIKHLRFEEVSNVEEFHSAAFVKGDIVFPHSLKWIEPTAFWSKNKKVGRISFPQDHKFFRSLNDGIVYVLYPLSIMFVGPHVRHVTIRNSVVSICQGAFIYSLVTSITIPSSIKKIDDYGFSQSALRSIKFETDSDLVEIGTSAFYQTLIRSIEFPSKLKSIDNNAFANCVKLKYISFPDDSNLMTIGNFGFSSTKIHSVAFPPSLKQIKSFAFFGCEDLITVKFPENSELSSLGTAAFHCTSITSFHVPPLLRIIHEKCFSNCKHLEILSFPNDCVLEEIQDFAFLGTNITDLTLPDSLKSIGTSAFAHSMSLNTVQFGPNSNLVKLGNECFMYSNLKQIILPPSLTQIKQALKYSIKLQIATFPYGSSVQCLETGMLICTNISKFQIPKSVTRIEKNAFSSKQLKEIEIDGDTQLEYVDQECFDDKYPRPFIRCDNPKILKLFS